MHKRDAVTKISAVVLVLVMVALASGLGLEALFLSGSASISTIYVVSNNTQTTTIVSFINFPISTVTTTSTQNVTMKNAFFKNESISTITVANTSAGQEYFQPLIAINPSSSANVVYVANNLMPLNKSTITVISGISNTVLGNFSDRGGADALVASSKTFLIYVANASCVRCSQSIGVYNGGTGGLVANINLKSAIDELVLDADRNRLYALNLEPGVGIPNQLFVINTTSNSMIANISVAGAPVNMHLNPVTNTLYFTNCGNELCRNPSLVAINAENYSVISSIPLPGFSQGMAVDPSRNTLNIAYGSSLLSINETSMSETFLRFSGYSPDCGSISGSIAINSPANLVYLACQSPTNLPNFFVIDTNNENVLNAFVDSGGPIGAVYNPNNNIVYLLQDNNYVLAVKGS